MNDELENWRKQIDKLDERVLNLLAKRAKIVRKIGQFKKERNIPALDKSRWNKVLNSMLSKSEELGLSKDFTKKLYDLIHKYSVKIQKESI